MHVVIRQLRHCLHDDGKLLHARNILNYVKLRPANRNVPKEMQKQIVSGNGWGGSLASKLDRVIRH
jgi:hypothetical protein